MRKYFIDNIRWVTVMLVLVYHVFYNFNAVGVLGGVGGFSEVQYQDSYLYLVYPWFMVLLFLVAGISSRYALEKKTGKEFFHSRTLKLLVPSTIGLFVFQWILGYFNIKAGGALDSIPAIVKYPIMAVSGTGPLWFIQDLWIYSLLLLLIIKILPGKRLESFFKEVNPNQCDGCTRKERCSKNGYCLGHQTIGCALILVVGFLLLWGASQTQIDNPKLAETIINGYRPLFYIVPFLMGYYVFALDSVQKMVARMHLPLLFMAIAGAVTYVITCFGSNYTSSDCLQSAWTNLYAWIAILAILGGFKTWADKTSKFATYMAHSSFGIYVVHMAVCTGTCFLLKSTTLPIWCIYIIALLSTLLVSPLLYELFRRIPFIRWCVLGIKKTKR